MPPLTQLKLGLVVAGLVLFGWGARVDDPRLRWIGIACLGVAFVLRFVGRKRDAEPTAPPDDQSP